MGGKHACTSTVYVRSLKQLLESEELTDHEWEKHESIMFRKLGKYQQAGGDGRGHARGGRQGREVPRFIEFMTSLAKKGKLYIVAGSIPVDDPGNGRSSTTASSSSRTASTISKASCT